MHSSKPISTQSHNHLETEKERERETASDREMRRSISTLVSKTFVSVVVVILAANERIGLATSLSSHLPSQHRAKTLHTAVPTECGSYFVWQSIGMVYSHRKIKQPGPLTRIVSCTPEEWEDMPTESKEIAQTHVAPNYAVHPRTGDEYPAYNKPMAVIDWLAKTDVKEDYVLIIDADMVMRRPIVPDPSSSLATSAFFGYMIGVNNELAVKVRVSLRCVLKRSSWP